MVCLRSLVADTKEEISQVTFFKGDKKVISGKYIDGLYYLQGSVVKGEVNAAMPKEKSTMLWHSRL